MKRLRRLTRVLTVLAFSLFGPLAEVNADGQDARGDRKLSEVEKAFEEAFDSQNHEQMVQAGLQLAEQLPNDAHLQFLLSSAYVSLNDHEGALKWLKKCAAGGYRNIGPSKKWKTFEGLKKRPEYKQALALIRENRTKAWEEFRQSVKTRKPLVVLPPGHDGEAATPLLLVLHRRGGTPEEIAEVFKPAAARIGAVLVAPRSIYKDPEGGWTWGGTYGWRYQREVVHEAVATVLAAAELVVKDHPIDQEKFFVAGFSQGADVALWVTQHQAFLIRGVLAIAPHDHELFERYRGSVRPIAPRFYLLVGSKDERLSDVLQIEDQILGANMPVKVRVIDGLGHELPKDPDEALLNGLNYMLGLDDG